MFCANFDFVPYIQLGKHTDDAVVAEKNALSSC